MSVIEVDTADLRAGGGKVSPKKSPLQVRTNVPLLSAEVLKEQLPAAAADLSCLPQAKMEVWSPRAVTQEEVDQQQAAASARKEVRHVPYHSGAAATVSAARASSGGCCLGPAAVADPRPAARPR